MFELGFRADLEIVKGTLEYVLFFIIVLLHKIPFSGNRQIISNSRKLFGTVECLKF